MTTVLQWGSSTDVGMVRETNQDCLLVAEPLFAVADGMGGHRGGEVASATALEILQVTFGAATSKAELLEAVRRANAKVWDKAQLDDSLHGMGTTLTAAALVEDDGGNDVFAVVNVGDSRAYLLRGGELHQVTKDHSFVEEMVRAGEITAEEAETHPKRNILTRALGVEPTVDVDVEEIEPHVGDRFLLCSDGLVREVGDEQIAATLRRLRNPDEAARELVSQAKSHGGHDNITVVIIDVIDDEQPVTINVPRPDRARRAAPEPSTRKPRRFTLRVVAFFLAIIALVAIACGSVIWYARASFYVGVEGDHLVVYRGRPEPVLWFHATIVERSDLTVDKILPSEVQRVRDGESVSSRSAAERYIENLRSEADAARSAANPTTTSSTTTTTKP